VYRASVRITVTISRNVARSLRGIEKPTEPMMALQSHATRLGVTLVPQHPRAIDDALIGFFVVTKSHTHSMDEVLVSLRSDASIEGAWVTPEEQLP
jgi:hypothetical protein